MKKNTERKIAIILCACVIGLLAIAIIPKNVVRISNAVVNEKNGDIAFCYMYPTNYSVLNVELYTKDGEKVFSKAFYTDATEYASLKFIDDGLLVRYRATNEKACLIDRDGNVLETNIPPYLIGLATKEFEGWNVALGKKTYSQNGYDYIYESPTVFRHRAKLTVTNGKQTNTLYDSKWFKK